MFEKICRQWYQDSRKSSEYQVQCLLFCLFFQLGDGFQASSDLQYVVLPLITKEKCIKPYTVYNSSQVTKSMVCAGNLNIGGVGTCTGDGGGPFIVPRLELVKEWAVKSTKNIFNECP